MDGLRVGVTGARKAAQLATALERRGAIAVLGPLVTTDVPVAPEVLLDATAAVVADPPAWLAASTGVGIALWFDVASAHGHTDDLGAALAGATRVARGAKAAGALAARGLVADHVTVEETDRAVLDWLLARAAPGDRVVVQLHGGDADDVTGELVDHGLDVVAVRPYVAGRLPDDEVRARALVSRLAAADLDVVTFTSPGAVRNLFLLAEQMGLGDEVAGALRGPVAVAVVGPVTGREVVDRGFPIAIAPSRHRQGELVRAIGRWASSRS